MNLDAHICQVAKEFNTYAVNYIDKCDCKSQLWKAMSYGVMNGGKRIRPYLIIELAKYIKIKKSNYMRLALATEFVHAYSLIHDDLPGMDNDDLRRGKPSTHKKHGEANAILAGNSLLTLAFEILSNKKTHPSATVRIRLIELLASLAGHKGLAGGQSLDLIYESTKPSENNILAMHRLKTAHLFEFCMVSTLILSGSTNQKKITEFRKYGNNFGLIFQAIDDLLDYNTDSKLDKKNRKMIGNNILKYKSLIEVKTYCKKLADGAIKRSTFFSNEKNPLQSLIYHMINRKT